MPLYIDIHELAGVTAADVAKAHAADVEVQGKYGVEYLKYWVNESCGKVFCLVHAPTSEAANRVHKEAHGLEAGRMIEVEPDLADGFIGGGKVNAGGAAVLPDNANILDTGMRTIMFTDIVESTSLTEQMGDQAAMGLLSLHDLVVRSALAALGGREVKHTGDGIMASFVCADAAVKCAMQIQRELATARKSGAELPVRVRIGAAAGEPVERHGDFFGSAVNLAARLCAHASPEQILVSTAVMELCNGKGLTFQEVGDVILKGFEHPVRVHAVR